MGYSPLTTKIVKPKYHKWSSRMGESVTQVIPHHWAGTAGGIEILTERNNSSSVNYIILSRETRLPDGTVLPDGAIIGSVPEEARPWTTSGIWDRHSITIEIQNSTLGPEWKISDKARASLVALTADIATRHKLKALKRGSTLRGHREFANTSCPGPYVWAQLPSVAAEAQALRTPRPVTKPAKPKPTKYWPDVALVVDGDFASLSTRAYQSMLKPLGYYTGYVDGVFGQETIKAEQRWLKKLGYYGGAIDGIRGTVTKKALQRFLKDKKYYSGKVDGWFGPATAKALQSYLNDQRRYYR